MESKVMESKVEKLIIIGSGPAGLTAAIYASRANLQPIVIEGKNPGGQLMSTTYIENWPGIQSILGPELMMRMRAHATHFNTRFIAQEVAAVDFSKTPFTISTTQQQLKSHTVIVATGAVPKKLNCPGQDMYWGKGVTTCAVCDGSLYKDKKIIIVGGGDTAMEDALFLSKFTNDVTIVHILEKLTASHIMQQRVLKTPSIKILYTSTISEIKGDGSRATHAVVTNTKNSKKTELEADGIFIAIGLMPTTSLFAKHLELTPYGHIALKPEISATATSVPGIFAAGDVADSRYRQAVTSAGTGCMAALDVERYLQKTGI
jgi:thioredoxin reductase (NADPH)